MLVLVPDLRWADAPTALDGWARANVSVRSARIHGTAADGYLTVGKGARSSTTTPGSGVGPVGPTGDGGVRLLDWDRLRRHDASLHIGGDLGAFGQALAGWGRPWALVSDDPDAAAAVADRRGVVERALRGGAATVRDLSARGEVEAMVVAVGTPDLGAVVDAAGPACVLVASVSTPGRNRHLGVLAASPPCGLGTQGLSSASTHQAHLATMLDVPVTFLSRLGIPRPPGMAGSAGRTAGPVARSTLVDRDRRASTADRGRTPLVSLFVVLTALGAAVALRWRRARPWVAWVLLAIPSASWLAMLVPWWRLGAPGILVPGIVLVAGLAGIAAIVGRDDARWSVGLLAAAVSLVVGVDAAFGGRLEIDAPFGNSAIGGGRFYGVGNIAAGFLMAGIVVATGLALERWGRRALPAAAATMGAGVIVGGAPWFGADVGGILASVPAYGTLLAAAIRGPEAWRRPSARLVIGLVGATVVVLALFVGADLTRPAADRTHLGRVVAGGDLGGEIVRKGSAALATLRNPMSLVAVVGVAALARARVLRRARPMVTATGAALAVAAVVGSVVNDSGLLVASAVAAVGWPALLVVADADTAFGPRRPRTALGPRRPGDVQP